MGSDRGHRRPRPARRGQRLKQAEGGDLLIWGTGQLTDALAAAGLLDEYRICTSPVIKGGGEPLFRPASAGTVELLDTKILATGAVVHAYRPASASSGTAEGPET